MAISQQKPSFAIFHVNQRRDGLHNGIQKVVSLLIGLIGELRSFLGFFAAADIDQYAWKTVGSSFVEFATPVCLDPAIFSIRTQNPVFGAVGTALLYGILDAAHDVITVIWMDLTNDFFKGKLPLKALLRIKPEGMGKTFICTEPVSSNVPDPCAKDGSGIERQFDLLLGLLCRSLRLV